MRVPAVDLRRQYADTKPEIDAAIAKVLGSGQFILGEEVKAFEDEFARYIGSKFAVSVGSGTDALNLSLEALGVGVEQDVITVANTFVASVDAISKNHARPVLVDADPETYNLDVRQIERKIAPRTKAIIAVHLYGRPADLNAIEEIADRHGLSVVEDASQACGARYHGRRVGSFGDISCFSLYPTKNLGAFGDGGIVTTSRKEFAERILMLRNYGQREKYVHEIIAHNSRLDEIQAAVLRVKLRHLDAWNELRRRHAKRYEELLSGIHEVTTPGFPNVEDHVYHLYVLRSRRRNELQEWLRLRGISTGIHYPIPIHLLPAYRYLNLPKGSFPVTEELCDTVLSLPMFPEITDDEIGYVAECVRQFCESR